MSMHKIPLTELERSGLQHHGLNIGTPSQLSDVFRLGVKHALAAVAHETPPGFVLVPLVMTPEMQEVTNEEGWTWADVLAAANSVTEEQYAQAGDAEPPFTEVPDPATDADSGTGTGTSSGSPEAKGFTS
jgi:hypothetical protein